MSPSAAAPRSASAIACSSTSASLCPSSPRSKGISTPPTTSRRPGANACTSKPCPTRATACASTSAARALDRGPLLRLPAPEREDLLGERQVGGERDLDVEVVALHEPRRVVAHRFHGLRLVGGVGLLLEAAAQQAVAEHLRRLRAPQVEARDRRGDALVLVRALQRVREGHREESPDRVVADLVEELLEELDREARPRRVVHEHPVVLRDLLLEGEERVHH